MASAMKGAQEWKPKKTTRERSTKEKKSPRSEVTVLQVVPPLLDVEEPGTRCRYSATGSGQTYEPHARYL
jgi:hypothetical protein